MNSERASAEHGVAAASLSTPSSVLASAPGRLRPEAAAVQSERPHAAFQRQLLVVCAPRQQRSSQSDSPRRLPESRHSARVSQSQASQSPHQRASTTRAVAPSFLLSVCASAHHYIVARASLSWNSVSPFYIGFWEIMGQNGKIQEKIHELTLFY